MSTAILSERDQLYRAILAEPADDAPRLIFADWLDENDGEINCPRCDGEGFILDEQTELSIKSYCYFCKGNKTIPNKFSEDAFSIRLSIKYPFMKSFGDYKELKNHTHFPWSYNHIVRRGFVDSVHLTLAQFLQHARDIAKAHPISRTGWVLTDRTPYTNGVEFWWVINQYVNDDPLATNRLPKEIFNLLNSNEFRSKVFRYYPTEQAARDDLAQALYTFARMSS